MWWYYLKGEASVEDTMCSLYKVLYMKCSVSTHDRSFHITLCSLFILSMYFQLFNRKIIIKYIFMFCYRNVFSLPYSEFNFLYHKCWNIIGYIDLNERAITVLQVMNSVVKLPRKDTWNCSHNLYLYRLNV